MPALLFLSFLRDLLFKAFQFLSVLSVSFRLASAGKPW